MRMRYARSVNREIRTLVVMGIGPRPAVSTLVSGSSSRGWITTKWLRNSVLSIGLVKVAIAVSPSQAFAAGNSLGAATCAARIRDKANRTTMMVQFTKLFQGLLA